MRSKGQKDTGKAPAALLSRGAMNYDAARTVTAGCRTGEVSRHLQSHLADPGKMSELQPNNSERVRGTCLSSQTLKAEPRGPLSSRTTQ